MTKKTHKQKVKMARKMLTPKEVEAHTPKFLSAEWLKRSKAINDRLSTPTKRSKGKKV